MSEEYTLDVRNMLCPMPVIKTQNQLKQLSSGDVLTVICTDPGSLKDIPAWCRINGHILLESQQNDQEITFRIQKQQEATSFMP